MGDQFVISGLMRKRAEVAGLVREAEQRLAELRLDLSHIDAALRIFAPESAPELIAAKRPHRPRGRFSHGELPRIIGSLLRSAGSQPMNLREIAESVMARPGLESTDPKMHRALQKHISTALRSMVEKGYVQRTAGAGRASNWMLVSLPTHEP